MVVDSQERSRLYLALLDGILFLYIFVTFEWHQVLALLKSIARLHLLIVLNVSFLVKVVLPLVVPFVVAVLFFACLGSAIFMGLIHEGRWPVWFRLACLVGLSFPLIWLLQEWGGTVWRLPQQFPSDLPRGLQDLLVAALFSDCGPRLRTSDTALSLGPSIGMHLVNRLVAIYLGEKYVRLAVFHERRGQPEIIQWVRFVPVFPVVLIVGFVSWGLWGDVQRQKLIAQVAQMEIAVIEPRETPYWHAAVEQCAVEGAEWRLPTIRELTVLSSGPLGKDSRMGAAWSGEVHRTGGPRGLRWTGERHVRPTYMPDVMHRCLSPHPTDLYQRLIVGLYPELYQRNRRDSFYRYFYPHEHFSVYGGLEGGRPEAVLCVKPEPIDASDSSSLHVAAEVKFVADARTAVSVLEALCSANQYEPTYCHRSTVHRYTDIDRRSEEDLQEASAVEQRFKARLEECRATANPDTCLGHGGIYLARGEHASARLFYEEACRKDGVAYASCYHALQLDEEEATFATVIDELMRGGLIAQKPPRHREAREPLEQACRTGGAKSCGYLAHVQQLQGRSRAAMNNYEQGCTLGDLWSCTHLALLQKKAQTTEQITNQLIELCRKGEPYACNVVTSWKLSEKEPKVRDALALASLACSLGSRVGCSNETVIRAPGYSVRVEELDPNTLRPSTPHDITGFRSDCVQNSNHCQGYVDRLGLQGQFKEAEWFKEQMCREQREANMKECIERIPWKNPFRSVTDTLIAKKYLNARPADHASLVPILKKACEEGVGHACWYMGQLMYDAMTGSFAGAHPVYSEAALLRPFQRACALGVVPGCTGAEDIRRKFAEGQFSTARPR